MNEYQPRNQGYNQPSAWPPPSGARGSFGAETAARARLDERMAFVRKVYALFFAATLFAIGGVALGLSFPPLLRFAFQHPWVMLFAMLGGVVGAQAVRHVRGLNLLALFGFTTLTGAIISPFLFWVSRNNPASIWQAGALTVGIFGGLTLYVFATRRDFDFMRGMLMTGLMVLVVAALLNFFALGSSAPATYSLTG